MASRTITSGGDYDLSDPVNSFVDVVRRVVFQPTVFFAALPRQGNLLNPLVFALICIEISVILVGLLSFMDVPGGINWLFGVRGNQGGSGAQRTVTPKPSGCAGKASAGWMAAVLGRERLKVYP
jgi:hypothetical protein